MAKISKDLISEYHLGTRSTVSENIPEPGSIVIISGEFLEGMRHNGLKDLEALKEYLDNSEDAKATEIYIYLLLINGKIWLIVQDNGWGMDVHTLAQAAAFGFAGGEKFMGRIGKFGFGMSMATIAKTRTAEIYSSQGKYEYNVEYIDMDYLAKNNMKLPRIVASNPFEKYPFLKHFEKGTVIVLKDCDRLDWKNPDTIANHIVDDLGETYRYYIRAGLKIFVNDKPVEPIDPFMAEPNHAYYSKLVEGLNPKDAKNHGYSKAYAKKGVDIIDVEYTDPATGQIKTSQVEVRTYTLPIEDIRRTALAKAKKKDGKNVARQAAIMYGIKTSQQGIYLVRGNRQIAGGETFGIWERHPSLNYFRCEVRFKPELDEAFGIHMNKSRFDPSQSILDKIETVISPYISDSREKAEAAANKWRKPDEPEEVDMTGEIMTSSVVFPPEAARTATKEQTKKKVLERVNELKERGEVDKALELEEAIDKEYVYHFDYEDSPRGSIFWHELDGGFTRIVLNRSHPFYRYCWRPAQDDPYMRVVLKLFIFSLVVGEQYVKDRDRRGQPAGMNELHDALNMQLRAAFENGKFQEFAEPKLLAEEFVDRKTLKSLEGTNGNDISRKINTAKEPGV